VVFPYIRRCDKLPMCIYIPCPERMCITHAQWESGERRGHACKIMEREENTTFYFLAPAFVGSLKPVCANNT
jgi:hypothetical protein